MNILITGGAGYIGSHTVQALLKSNLFSTKIVIFDNLSNGSFDSIPSEVKFVLGDIRNTSLLTTTLIENKIQAVIHFAAKLIVPESVRNPLEYYDNNVNGIISLAEACRKARVRKIIFSSSGAVYGEPTNLENFIESDLTLPVSPYGSSKLMGERILQDCENAFGLKFISLRYFNVAGASADGSNGQRAKHTSHIIDVACEAALKKRDFVEIYGTDFSTFDGTGIRDYIHVEDLADLHVRSLNYLNNTGKSNILNCGYGTGFSVRQIIETIKTVSSCNFKVKEVARRAGDPSRIIANNDKIKNLFQWVPKFADIEFICKSSLEWKKKKL